MAAGDEQEGFPSKLPAVHEDGHVEDASMGGSGGSSSSGEDDDREYLLGFAEPPSDGPPTKPGVRQTGGGTGAASLLRHRFPSKAGGAPAWLDPLRLPPRSALACPGTGAPYRFLLQVYAPDEAAGDRAFHRALFLFVSPSGERLARGEPGAARAFRCQLPRRNRYYGYHPGGEDQAAPVLLEGAERELALERDPWRVARREAVAAGVEAAAEDGEDGDGPEPFREMELVVEPEPEDDDADDVMAEVARVQQQQQQQQQDQQAAGSAAAAGAGGGTTTAAGGTAATPAAGSGGVGRAAVARLLADYERRARDEGSLTDDELPPSLMDELERALGRERAAFAAFQARVARAPAQVLRYCFAEGAAPLWPSASRVPGPGDVPPCGRCGGPRRFEFQVMPQLLSYLGVDEDDPSAPDWGTIAVYSCAASCGGGGGGGGGGDNGRGGDNGGDGPSAYAEEFVWLQPPATA